MAEANRNRPAEIVTDLLGVMIQRCHRKLRQAMGGLTLLIDSTSMSLNALSEDWARFSDEVCDARLGQARP